MRKVVKLLVPTIAAALSVLIAAAIPAAAQNGYAIRSGDSLMIEVLEEPSLNRTVLVLPDGSISFPSVGAVRARGLTVEQVRNNLSTALAPNYAAPPNVYVSVASLAESRRVTPSGPPMMDVFAMGEFESPGRKEVKRGTTLLQFLAEAGGLAKFAAEKRIELHRTAENGTITTYLFNLRQPRGGPGTINGGTVLRDGDVIMAPEVRLFE